MKGVKKIVAAVIAAASIGAIGVTASAAETVNKLPVDWIAVKANGAPTSVNKTYYYPVYLSGEGYDITCTTFESDYDGTVEVGRQYRALNRGVILSLDENITDLHNKTRTPIHVKNPSSVYDDYITFSFYAHCINNCRAGGTISRAE